MLEYIQDKTEERWDFQNETQWTLSPEKQKVNW